MINYIILNRTAAMPILKNSGLIFGGYANGFTSIKEMQPGQTVDELTAEQTCAELMLIMPCHGLKKGISLADVVKLAHIAELARQITAAGHDIITLDLA